MSVLIVLARIPDSKDYVSVDSTDKVSRVSGLCQC